MRIAVIDGQGGGVGRAVIEKLCPLLGTDVELIALGTNAIATSAMLRAGAHMGATGENAIVYNAARVDLIIGPIGIVIPNAMLGECTPNMAANIAQSPAHKVLIPFNKCNLELAGLCEQPLSELIDDAITLIMRRLSARP